MFGPMYMTSRGLLYIVYGVCSCGPSIPRSRRHAMVFHAAARLWRNQKAAWKPTQPTFWEMECVPVAVLSFFFPVFMCFLLLWWRWWWWWRLFFDISG